MKKRNKKWRAPRVRARSNHRRLVLYLHGSQDPRWRAPFERLLGRLQRKLGRKKVRLAYMEFARPTLQDIATEAVRDRCLRLRLLPLFLAGGAHVAIDLPDQVADAQLRFPGLQVEVLQPVGLDPRMVALMREIALEAAA